ncbi:MAG: energy transducer TonB [Terriglobales bacterium]|jgi:TonB family protein
MPDNFKLGLLPERKIDWRTLAASYGFVTFAILCLLFVGILFPEKLQLTQRYISTELIARTAPPPPKPVKVIKKAPRPVIAKVIPAVVMAPKLIVPKDIRIKPKKQEDIDAPKLDAKFNAPVVVPVSAVMPKQIVQTGQFGSSAPATVVAPIQKVQTGGFGAPDGLKGQGKEGAHLQTASLGSFDLPQGAGQGNGTGGAKGIKGTVASTGFGNGVAQQDGHRNGGTAQVGGFGGQQVAQASQHLSETGAATTPVQILYKPNPAYTAEARQLQLQGEVLLEVMFGANGQLQVNKVVRGLGHGLDESAVAAANKMKFKPALRNGSAVDSTAIVHVVFQLAS